MKLSVACIARVLFCCYLLLGSITSGANAVVFHPVPDNALYPDALADSRYPKIALSFPIFLTQAIDTQETTSYGGLREFLEFGGAKSLFRFSPADNSNLGVELSIGAAIFTQFDSFADRLENFGWEGSGFVTIVYKPIDTLAIKFGFHHLSSHIGDEYIANYDVLTLPIQHAQEIEQGTTYGMNYVRDSLMLGLSWQPIQAIRLYGELRHAQNMLVHLLRYNDFPWQCNGGVEFLLSAAKQVQIIPGAWYSAIDVSMYEESSWFPSITMQIGRIIQADTRGERFRIGFEYYYGRPLIAVFNHTTEQTSWEDIPIEQHIAIGMWYDL